MSNNHRKRSVKKGLPPGTLYHVGKKSGTSRISVVDYNPSVIKEKKVAGLEEIWPPVKGLNRWIMVEGVSDTGMISSIGMLTGLNPLLMEDIVNTEQRPKYDDYGEVVMITLRALRQSADGHIESEQCSLVAGPNFLISFQELQDALFEPVLERLRKSTGSIRQLGHEYLLYALVDLVVDNYFSSVEHLGERLESLEDEIFANPTGNIPALSQQFKKDLFTVRKAVMPLREALHKMIVSERFLTNERMRLHLNDVYDHILYILDTLELYRDLINELKDTHLSQLSNRMNKVMQLLTVISTVFIPLTFIVGVYGMNFKRMPELEWKYGYLAIWIVILLSGTGMLIYFRRKKWL